MKNHKPTRRRGVAALELAIATPLLFFLIIGLIQVGQYAEVAQIVTNASRAGGRMAARSDVSDIAVVQNEVGDYLKSAFPRFAAADIESAFTVGVTNLDGSAIAGADLNSVPTGQTVRVDLTFQFSAVSWLPGLDLFTNQSISRSSLMRRE